MMSASPESQGPSLQLLVGTYTEQMPHVNGKAEGILSCTFAGGRVGPPRLAATIRNPSFIMATPSGENVYAASETFQFEGKPGGGLTSFSRDAATGDLHLLNAKPTGGDSPCFIAVDARGKFVLVANYAASSDGGSVAVFRREEDGSLGEMTDFVEHVGSGPDPVRQVGSHPHMIIFHPLEAAEQAPDGDLLVPDLGTDVVLTYSLDPDGKLAEKQELRLPTAPGAGPRHVRFHPNRSHLFILNELDSTLMLVRREPGGFVPITTLSTLGPGSFPNSTASEVRVAASGEFVFASNRGPDSDTIAMFRFDEHSEQLALVHLEPSRGEVPREFTLSPDDRYLLVANQNTDAIVTFEIRRDQPGLSFVSATQVPTPVSLLFP